MSLYWKFFTLTHMKAKERLVVLLLRVMFSSLMELRGNVNPQADGSASYLSGRRRLPVSPFSRKTRKDLTPPRF